MRPATPLPVASQPAPQPASGPGPQSAAIDLPPDPFHAGERSVHARLGIESRMREIGRRVIRDHLPAQHRDFYAQLPFVVVGAVDGRGRPWASLLAGAPGFLSTPDERRLAVRARPVDGDPLAEGLRAGAPLGFLGIELRTRRRNRVNGRVARADADGFELAVEQTIGNCPQYIHPRELAWVRDPTDDHGPRAVEPVARLGAAERALIGQADTLFVATHAPAPEGRPGGADVSHRGGPSGFVRLEDDGFVVPDYAGNRMFMTLGNLQLDARAGVLFVDFERGDLLTLTGRAEVLWDPEAVRGMAGAERAWRFRLDEGRWLRDAIPLRWRAGG